MYLFIQWKTIEKFMYLFIYPFIYRFFQYFWIWFYWIFIYIWLFLLVNWIISRSIDLFKDCLIYNDLLIFFICSFFYVLIDSFIDLVWFFSSLFITWYIYWFYNWLNYIVLIYFVYFNLCVYIFIYFSNFNLKYIFVYI